MDVYDKCAGEVEPEEGERCWIGVDVSATTDLTAVVAAFRGEKGVVSVLPHFFLPKDNLADRSDRDGVPYSDWVEQGFVTATPGNVIDYSTVTEHIRKLCASFDVREIAFDRAYAQAVMGPLTEDGLPVITMQQGWVTQSPALNELERLIIGGKFRHGGNPVLRWNFANVAIATDANNNRLIRKSKSTGRVDGVAATWMAVARAVANDNSSAWDDPDFDVKNFILAA
jgi:phage terminase large subunit-like protein